MASSQDPRRMAACWLIGHPHQSPRSRRRRPMAEHATADVPDPDEFTDNSPNPAGDTDLLVLADALQEQGVTRVVLRYDGSGDSGGAYEVEAEPQEALLPRWVEDQLRDVAEGCCPDG